MNWNFIAFGHIEIASWMMSVCLTCVLTVFLCYRVDPFTRKDWYDIVAPSNFKVRQMGKTLVNRTQGTSKYFALRCLCCRAVCSRAMLELMGAYMCLYPC